MSVRRPRIKPIAILKPRRQTCDQNVPEKDCQPTSSDSNDINTNAEPPSNECNTSDTKELLDVDLKTETEPLFESDTAIIKIEPQSKPKPPARRLIKPSVVLPVRKKAGPVAVPSKIETVQDEQQSVDQKPDIIKLQSLAVESESPSVYDKCSADDYFKSPFVSPSMQSNQRVTDPPMGSSIVDDIAPLSPVKVVRQRIRPTPFFNHRRNSIQGNTSDCDADDTNRRQRHLSTSSSHSSHNITAARPPIGRIRTESTCSTMSDINSSRAGGVGAAKVKKGNRSEAMTKIANRLLTNRFNGQTPDKARLTMFDMIYYNPLTNPMKNPATKSNEHRDRRSSVCSVAASVKSVDSARSVAKLPAVADVAASVAIKSEVKEETAMPVPQLKLGPDGEIILDEQSLVIETTCGKEARATLANADIVYDDEFSGTSGFYKRSKRTKDWPAEETIKFYRCLHTIGTDFSMMLSLFPKRSRRDLKLKFKREEKFNLNLINKALLHPKLFNIDDLKAELEKEEEEEAERRKAEWQELKAKQKKTKNERLRVQEKKSQNRVGMALRTITEGDIYEHEFTVVPKRRNIKMKRCDVDPTADKGIDNSTKPPAKKRKTTAKKKATVEQVSDVQMTTCDEIIRSPGPTCLNRERQTKVKAESTAEVGTIDVEPEKIQPSIDQILLSDKVKTNYETANEYDDDLTMADLREANLIPDNGDDNEFILSESTIQELMDEEHPNDASLKANSNDILNMEIIFDHDGYDTAQIQAAPMDGSRLKEEHMDDSLQLLVPMPENTAFNSSYCDVGDTNQDVEEDDDDDKEDADADAESDDDEDDDSDNDMEQVNNQGSLVVVASQDSKDPTKIVHEIFVMSPTTGQLSEEPLDLPPDVIQQIMLTMNPP